MVSCTPKNLQEALQALKEHPYLPYAGGTDINNNPMHRDRDFLFIGKLPELRALYADEEYLHLGGAVTFAEAQKSELVPEIMKEALKKLAGPAIRNRGTFGGNLANASGKADSALVDIVLDAKIHICSAEGERFVNAADFYQGFRKVDLGPQELITEILIPRREYFINYFYNKVSVRTSVAISNFSVASVWETDGKKVKKLAIAIGSATEYPIRCTEIEEALTGKTFEEIAAGREELLAEYVTEIDMPLDRTAVWYRKQICYRLLRYLIREEFTPIR